MSDFVGSRFKILEVRSGLCSTSYDMYRRSIQLNLALPAEIVEAYCSCQSMKNLTAFARTAIIQKLNREFGFSLDEALGDFSRGRRTDLRDPALKRKRVAALQEHACRARERKKTDNG